MPQKEFWKWFINHITASLWISPNKLRSSPLPITMTEDLPYFYYEIWNQAHPCPIAYHSRLWRRSNAPVLLVLYLDNLFFFTHLLIFSSLSTISSTKFPISSCNSIPLSRIAAHICSILQRTVVDATETLHRRVVGRQQKRQKKRCTVVTRAENAVTLTLFLKL